MNIIFLIKSDRTPSSRIRVKELIPYLEKKGTRCTAVPLPDSFSGRLRLFAGLGKYDVVILQKRLLNLLEFKILRMTTKKLVFDFDDAIYLKNASPSQNEKDYESRTRQHKFRRTVRSSDLVISSGSVLDAYLQRTEPGKAGNIVPTAVDTNSIITKKSYALQPVPVIGWTGTKSTLRYIDYIAPALLELRKKHRFILRIIADAAPVIDGLETEFIPWKLESQYNELRRFDIGIMPLSSDPFSEGKAAYKLLQYFACGLPSVLSPVGVNKDIAAKTPAPCLSAENPGQFAGQLSALLESEELRTTCGQNGRRLAETEYSFEKAALEFIKALNKISV